MAFLLAELGTSGSLDGQQRLVVKGRFAPKVFEGILRRYVSKSFQLLFFRVLILMLFVKVQGYHASVLEDLKHEFVYLLHRVNVIRS